MKIQMTNLDLTGLINDYFNANKQYTANVNRITIINWQDNPSLFRHNLSPI